MSISERLLVPSCQHGTVVVMRLSRWSPSTCLPAQCRQKAFTLLEMVAVLVLILVLAGIAVPTYRAVIGETRENAAVLSAQAYRDSIDAYAAAQQLAPDQLAPEVFTSPDGLLASELAQDAESSYIAGTVRLCLGDGSTLECADIMLSSAVGGRSAVTLADLSPQVTSPLTLFVPGDGTPLAVELTATDPEGATLTWDLAGGVDAGLFALTAGGELSTADPLDFALPLDSNTDNVYELDVTVSDGANLVTATLVVDVLEVRNRTLPTPATLVEVVALDLPPTPAFTLVGGGDQALFAVDPDTGSLAFTAPVTGAVTDSDANGVYEVWVLGTVGADSRRVVYRITVAE